MGADLALETGEVGVGCCVGLEGAAKLATLVKAVLMALALGRWVEPWESLPTDAALATLAPVIVRRSGVGMDAEAGGG